MCHGRHKNGHIKILLPIIEHIKNTCSSFYVMYHQLNIYNNNNLTKKTHPRHYPQPAPYIRYDIYVFNHFCTLCWKYVCARKIMCVCCIINSQLKMVTTYLPSSWLPLSTQYSCQIKLFIYFCYSSDFYEIKQLFKNEWNKNLHSHSRMSSHSQHIFFLKHE